MDQEHKYRQETAVLTALMGALQDLPHVRAALVRSEHPLNGIAKSDAKIDVAIAGKPVTLLVELKQTVYPRDIRQILWRLRQARDVFANDREPTAVPLVAAESVSTGARDLLRIENVGFFDMGGSLFVPAPGAYLYVDRPAPAAQKKNIRSLFTNKRSQVLHALLVHRRAWIGAIELSTKAEVSPGTASETLTALERMEWVSSRGQGPNKERQLSNPSALLDEWRSHVLASRRSLARRRFYVSGNDSTTLAHRLADLCADARVEYVLTQDIAAQLYAPFLSSVSRVACRMMPGATADEIMDQLKARPVSEGANLDVIETTSRSEFLFKEEKAQLSLASPVQTYLDLLRSEGRSRDMAEHLRHEVLKI
ncbi:MAG: hypothetical protein LCH93_22375 [Proteobacteria bacterium]|nr:hypothetical protein [Pseudomonadota bacterium]